MPKCQCPKCGVSGEVPEAAIGRSATCRKCNTVFTVQATNEAAILPLDLNDLLNVTEIVNRPAGSIGDVAQNIAEQYFAHRKTEQEHTMKVLLLLSFVVFVALFFCCGLPVLMSPGRPPGQ